MMKFSQITESIWSDLQKRSSGEVTRKEDDVDLLDREGLVDYLKKNYEFDQHQPIIQTHRDNCIIICLYDNQYGYTSYLDYDNISMDPEIKLLQGINSLKKDSEQIYSILTSKYMLTESPENYSSIIIEPKGGRYIKITNNFFLDVLDTILENIHKPLENLLKKL